MKCHYQIVITACCFLFLFVNVGMPSTSFSVYQPYLVGMVGDSGGSLVLSVRTFATLAATFVVNRFYMRLDCRLTITLGCLLTAAGFACYSLADGLPMLFAGALLAGVGYSLGGVVGMTLLIGRWYKARVGTAVGFATVGSGFAGFIVPAIAVQVIHGVSLAAAFRAEALFALVVAVIVFVLVRNHPSDIGARPFGEDAPADAQERRKVRGTPAPHDAAHLPRRTRVLLVVAMACVGMVCIGAMAYLSILLTTNGFEPGFAALMLSLTGGCLVLSKIATGELFDRIGTLRGTAVVFALCIAGFCLCLAAPLASPALAVGMAILLGCGMSIGSVGISVWSLELSNPATRTKTVKDFQLGYAFGGFVGDTFPGFLAEACGSYVPTYAIILAGSVFAAILILSVYKKYRTQP